MKLIKRVSPYERCSPWYGYVRTDFCRAQVITAVIGLNLILYFGYWFHDWVTFRFANLRWEKKIEDEVRRRIKRYYNTGYFNDPS